MKFQASTTVQLKFLLFWVVVQHTLVVCYQSFLMTHRCHTDMYPKMSVILYNLVKFLKTNTSKIISYNRFLSNFVMKIYTNKSENINRA